MSFPKTALSERLHLQSMMGMELSEYVYRGIQTLADPSIPVPLIPMLLQAAFQSLLDAQADETALDHPDLKHIVSVILKHCRAAAVTSIQEAGKHQVDSKSTLSTDLENCTLDRGQIELFCSECQDNKSSLDILLGSVGRSLPHITDISWRLEYQIQTNQLHKMCRPGYLVTLNIENSDFRSYPEIQFRCNMERLQDLVGKLKDAAKSLETATQL